MPLEPVRCQGLQAAVVDFQIFIEFAFPSLTGAGQGGYAGGSFAAGDRGELGGVGYRLEWFLTGFFDLCGGGH